jgi:hypothetical protein
MARHYRENHKVWLKVKEARMKGGGPAAVKPGPRQWQARRGLVSVWFGH